ncbi:NUDIX hydrolase [Stutzerimonas zhaodongensis]|uniref:NUDIX hydrolase n=1 Tax=Stutzerimonas TaxID=2901164 RepID=UPI0038910724
MPHILNIATACLLNDAGRLLVVRKRGAHYFMLPGGKAEPGETAAGTLIRELDEELALETDESQLQYLGHFESRAANEPDHWVKAEVFVARLSTPVKIQAEIEESGWIAIDGDSERLAPLLREEVLPALRRRLSI